MTATTAITSTTTGSTGSPTRANAGTWSLACGDVLPGCGSVLRGDTRDAVLAAVATHAERQHGIIEIDPGTLAAVEAALRTG